jgi:U3 small nucleolar ribonucleoprotein component
MFCRAPQRPLNSLLEAELEYEHAARPAPVVTDKVCAVCALRRLLHARVCSNSTHR